jgi:MFS transporter, MCT family, solute carrier family 16 (monocarboxylic acid transporters), member 10
MYHRPITKDDPTLSTTLLGLLFLSRGLGNVLSTPISTALSHGGGDSVHPPKFGFDVDGGKYEKMIVYVGTCFVGAAIVSAVAWRVDQQSKR